MLREHLALAKSREAAVLVFGDLFDLMAGKHDPRAAKDEIRPEFLVDDYIDEAVSQFDDYIDLYAQNIALVSQGNHEHTIRERAETCVVRRVVENINSRNFCTAIAGEYAGWVRFAFTQNDINRKDVIYDSCLLHYHHGVRGGGPADLAELNQRAAECPDADILVAGHTHAVGQRWIRRTRVTKNGQIYDDDQLHLRCGGYKNDHGLGTKGWAVRKGIKAKTLGNWWVRFFWCPRRKTVWFEPIPAM